MITAQHRVKKITLTGKHAERLLVVARVIVAADDDVDDVGLGWFNGLLADVKREGGFYPASDLFRPLLEAAREDNE